MEGNLQMKLRLTAAAAAMLALVAPNVASADDGLKYEELVHCAAFNTVVAGVLSDGEGATKNKDNVDMLTKQSAALLAFATLSSDKKTDAVIADMNKESDVVIAELGKSEKMEAYLKENTSNCMTLGQAAVEVIEDLKKEKK